MANLVEVLELPIRVFVDTSIYEGLSFAFDGPVLSALSRQGEQHNIRLLLPRVTALEVTHRIHLCCQESETLLQKTHASCRVFRQTKAGIDCVNRVPALKVAQELCSRWQDLLSQAWVRVLSPRPPVLERVLADYFATRAPFEEKSKKRCEFPDSIALHTIAAEHESIAGRVFVVSSDAGMEKFCNDRTGIVYCDSLERFLAEVSSASDQINEITLDWLKPYWGQINDWAKELVADLDVEFEGGEIGEFKFTNVEADEPHVLELDGKLVTVGLTVNATFQAGVSVGHPADPSAYQTWLNVTKKIPAAIQFSLETESLEHAKFELEGRRLSFSESDDS